MLKSFFGALLLLCTLPVTGQTPQDSIAFATAPWQITPLGRGAECRYAQIDLFGSRQSISVASYPRRAFNTRIVQLTDKALPTSQIGKSSQAKIAINGSYFNVKTLEPATYIMRNGKVLGHTTEEELMRTNGVIAFRDQHGRKPVIIPCDTTDYPLITRNYHSAMASGPVLVHQGKIVRYDSRNSFYTDRHPRSLIGLTRDGRVVMVVIDGRFPGQGEGTTIAQTAYIAKQLGLVEALNLDGGGSSTLWTLKKGVLNHPYDNKRFDHKGERSVPNGIVVRVR